MTRIDITEAKSWLFDILWVNGTTGGRLLPTANRGANYYLNHFNEWWARDCVKTVIEFMRKRNIDLKLCKELDQCLDNLSRCYFRATTTPQSAGSVPTDIRRKQKTLAAYVAWFCSSEGLYCDDSLLSTYEMDEIKKTVIGNTLWEYKCFTSQDDVPVQTTSSSIGSTGGGAKGNVVNKGKKASFGTLSDKITNLVGQPNVKKYAPASGVYVYCIDIVPQGGYSKYITNIFVKLFDAATTGTALSKSKAEKVRIGRGNDYFDCKLFWFSPNDADTFCRKCIADFPSGTQIGNITIDTMRIAKEYPDSNGYFEISTDYGNAYVKASKLNEDIMNEKLNKKEINTTSNNKVKKKNAYEIHDIDTFEEVFRSSLD